MCHHYRWELLGIFVLLEKKKKKRKDLRNLDLYGLKWDSTLQHAELLD